jgi:CheY-like chemotaxis protein
MATRSCPRCVLIIEDDEALREAIAALLEDLGYLTVSAEDAQRAVDLLLQPDLARPCLVLADLITLRVDWATLINALQPDDQLATLPMALIAVKAGRPERIKKPIDFDLLARIVKEHCCGGDGEGPKPTGGRSSVGSTAGS